jgi:hypothetical protein
MVEEVGEVLSGHTAVRGWVYKRYNGVKVVICAGGLDKLSA